MSAVPEAARDRLYQMIAAIGQREYEDSLTPGGTVANAQHLGIRIAAEVINLFDSDEITDRWEVRGKDPEWAGGGWFSPFHKHADAVKFMRDKGRRSEAAMTLHRIIEARTVAEQVEVKP